MPVIKKKLENNTDPNPYNVSNPHPEFGINPNIKNEFGHTEYPKLVYHPTQKEKVLIKTTVGQANTVTNMVENAHTVQVLVHSKEEEDKLLGKKVIDEDDKKNPKGWDKN